MPWVYDAASGKTVWRDTDPATGLSSGSDGQDGQVQNLGGGDAPIDPAAQAAAAQARADAAAQAAKVAAYNGHFQYGDNPGGAQEAAGRYANYGLMGQARAAPQVDRSQTEWDRTQAGYARNNQGEAMSLMAARARGQVPSIATMQANRQMGQAAAEQSSAAASARGPAALALAQQGAAANTANLQSQISNQAQINGAQERMQAEQGYLGAATTMRQGDFAAGGLAAQQAQAQAQIDLSKQNANDQYQMGMTQAEIDVRKAQLGAQGNQVAIESGAANAAANRAQAGDQYDSSRMDKYIGYGLGAAGTAAAIAVPLLLGGGGGKAAPGMGGPEVGGGGTTGGAPTSGWSNADGSPISGAGGGYDPDDPSDVTAKTNIRPMSAGAPAGLMGRADPRADAWDEGHRAALQDLQKLARKSPAELKAYGDNPLAQAVRGLKADAWDEGRRGPAMQQDPKGLVNQAPPVDPGTAQLANGLMPSFYDYKRGIGTPGEKFGPMAQNMAANPATATAVRQDPNTGLLAIDGKDGLKVALGGVGHLAQRQAMTEQQLALLQQANGVQSGLGVQGQGLVDQGPSIGEHYLNTVRGYR